MLINGEGLVSGLALNKLLLELPILKRGLGAEFVGWLNMLVVRELLNKLGCC